jgi:homoserine kinase type II
LASGDRVFLRVYEEQTTATATREASLLSHLSSLEVPTPRPIPRTDVASFITEHAGKPVALFPWRDGEILCQARVTEDAAYRVGSALARIHAAGASFDGAGTSRFDASHLAVRLADLQARDLVPELAAVVERLTREVAERRASVAATCEIPVIHGDLFRDNVLWAGGEIAALLDFESASRGLASFDLMVTALAWCFGDRLDPALLRAMGRGYASVRNLTPAERGTLYDEARFAAIRFSVTRITDFELRPRGSGVYKDYRRFLARLDAIAQLGRDGLVTLISP